jgi:uncharacterized protein (TIGR03435 family)
MKVRSHDSEMRIWRGVALSALMLAGGTELYAQSGQGSKSFEVASVKRLPQPSASVRTGGGPGTSDPGRWWRSNVTLASLLVEAFRIEGHAIIGPDWLRSSAQPRYEIVAKVPAGANRDDIPLMLQKLIIERFGLRFHREQKEMPGYALVTGRNGPKLNPSTSNPASVPHRDGYPDFPQGVAPGVIQVDSVGYVHRFLAGAMSMAQFADYLAGQSDLPIIDRTELREKYDIVLYYSKPVPLSANPEAAAAENALDLPSALREQLGLELRPQKARVEALIIDHIDQTPSPN